MKAAARVSAVLAVLAWNASWALEPGAYVPAFRDPTRSPLGLNAATVVHLAIWRTLRSAPYPNPNKSHFGDAIVRWGEDPLGDVPPTEAALKTGVPLVVDGSVFKYGTGAVVTTRLYVTAPTTSDKSFQTWTIKFDVAKLGKVSGAAPNAAEIESDVFPERVLEFASIPLQGDDLKKFESAGLIEVHKSDPNGPVIGRVGDSFRGWKQFGNTAWVRTDEGLVGYVALPRATPELTSMASFIGAVIRILRSDWNGASELFVGSAKSEVTPTSLRIDSELMSAFCLEKQGKSGIGLVETAVKLSPSAPRVLKYKIMVIGSSISRFLDANSTESARQLIPEFAAAVEDLSLVSAKDDPWISKARSIVQLLDGSRGRAANSPL